MQASKCPEGTKPMLLFAGEAFDTDNEHKRLKSLLIGWYFVQTEPDVLFHTSGVKLIKDKNICPPVRLFQRSKCVCGASGWVGACFALHVTRWKDLHAQLQVGGCVYYTPQSWEYISATIELMRTNRVALLQVFIEEVWLQNTQN